MISEEMLAQMGEMMKEAYGLQIPPPIFLEMGGEFLDIDMEMQEITLRFPVLERFQNPMGYMQGGMVAAAVDNAIGPLSFIVAPPSVTKTLQMEYVRPVRPEMTHIDIKARCESIEKREAQFTAVVLCNEGQVLARATAVHVILNKKR